MVDILQNITTWRSTRPIDDNLIAVFAPHGTAEHGRNSVAQIEAARKRITAKHTQVAFFIERGAGGIFLPDIKDFQQSYDKAARAGSILNPIDWDKELTAPTLSSPSQRFLESRFHQWATMGTVEIDADITRLSKGDESRSQSGAAANEYLRYIAQQRSQGLKCDIYVETPPLDSFIAKLRASVADYRCEKLLLDGDVKLAIQSYVLKLAWERENSEIRDSNVINTLQYVWQKSPRSLVVLLRGTAHAPKMQAAFARAEVPVDLYCDDPNIVQRSFDLQINSWKQVLAGNIDEASTAIGMRALFAGLILLTAKHLPPKEREVIVREGCTVRAELLTGFFASLESKKRELPEIICEAMDLLRPQLVANQTYALSAFDELRAQIN